MNKINEIWNRIKQIKHLPIITAVFIGLLICVIYFSSFVVTKNDNNIVNTTEEYSSASEYVDNLENKLVNVLSKISGVQSVNALITLESGFSYKYATETETRTTTSGGQDITITTEKVVYVDDKPVVEQEIYPVIKGVVIVAKGAENFTVKMNILDATETILQIDRSNITILS